MVRLTLVVITLFVISLMCTGVIYAEIWYEENFDDFKDGELAGQEGWTVAHGQASPTVQDDVAFGDTGKSVLVEEGTFGMISFPDAPGGTQHISFHCRKDTATGWLLHYTGGGGVKWGGAAVFPIPPGTKLKTIDVGAEIEIADITLGKWHYLHVVLDFGDKTYDFYVDGEQVANDFGFRGQDNPNFGWFNFGWNKVEGDLVAYIDNISAGDGEGDPNPPDLAVFSSGKLPATWAELKK